MLEVGSVVEARIVRKYQYGLELECDRHKISVRVTDIADGWQAAKQKLADLTLGQTVLVMINHYASKYDTFLGTLTSG